MGKQLVRFNFAIDEGPNAGLHCGGWRVWCTGEDTYITTKSLNGTWKTSLHGDVAWQTAITSENIRSNSPRLRPGEDRAPWKYEVPAFVDGKRLAFVIAVTRSALLPGQVSQKEIQVPTKDAWNLIRLVRVWMTEPGVKLEGLEFVGNPLFLQSGRCVWLDTVEQTMAGWSTTPDKPAAGLLVEVLTPGQHGTQSPGFLVKGVHMA